MRRRQFGKEKLMFRVVGVVEGRLSDGRNDWIFSTSINFIATFISPPLSSNAIFRCRLSPRVSTRRVSTQRHLSITNDVSIVLASISPTPSPPTLHQLRRCKVFFLVTLSRPCRYTCTSFVEGKYMFFRRSCALPEKQDPEANDASLGDIDKERVTYFDGQTERRTNPVIEMRERQSNISKSFTIFFAL